MRKTKPSFVPSIRLLVTLIVAMPVALVAIALAVISGVASKDISQQLGDSLVASSTARVSDEVRNYLGDAVRVSDLYIRRLETNRLSTQDMSGWKPYMIEDLLTTPRVASICFGNQQGDSTWFLRAHNRLEYGYSEGSNDSRAIEFPADPKGVLGSTPIRVYQYDPRVRPWYTTALKIQSPTWTPAYFWFGNTGAASETGSGYTRVVHSPDGKTAGVLVIDVTLSALSQQLRDLPVSQTGSVFIIDEEGLLIAASDGPVNSSQGERLSISASSNAAAKVAAAEIKASAAGAGQDKRINVGKEAARLNVMPIAPYPGIQWRIVTIIPEKTYLSEVVATRSYSFVFAAIATVVGLLLGLVFSRRLSRPLLQLVSHVVRVGGGDFDARLELRQARELSLLSTELNQMTAGLRRRLELEHSLSVATLVQQALLPRETPKSIALDVAGQSRYCDSTGGDYYDFIAIPGASGQTLFAVGDVTGHGIGAALLMASARASLRASLVCTSSLGELMSRVNGLLSQDQRHGLFMTLLLLTIDPETRDVRWSSAGHDPAIVFDPANDEFLPLSGNDIPIGIDGATVYKEYKRQAIGAGSIIMLGTDGIWEARNDQDQMFGKDRLCQCIKANAKSSALEITSAIDRTLSDFIGKATVKDDITFVVIKLSNPEQDRAGASYGQMTAQQVGKSGFQH